MHGERTVHLTGPRLSHTIPTARHHGHRGVGHTVMKAPKPMSSLYDMR